DRHTQWIEILFGAPLLVIGAAWLVVWLARVATGRARRRDLAVLTFLYVNTIYIYMFAEGSSVHLYRVFFFSGFFTLAVVDLAVDGAHAVSRLAGDKRVGMAAGALLALVYLGVEAPHAWANLIESRELMGTHSQPGYNPDAEKLFFAREVTKLTKPSDRVIVLYRQLGSRKEFWYYLDRSLDEIGGLNELPRLKASEARSVLILDERQLGGAERAIFDGLIKRHPVTFYERFALVDLRSNQPGARSFAFVRGPMTASYRWLVSHKYAPLHLERRAYLYGLCDAVAVGAPVARDEEPPPPPSDPRLASCWHNYLVARGDGKGAQDALKRATVGMQAVERYLGGARVIAAGTSGGRLRLAILAAGPETGELRYVVRRGAASTMVPRTDLVPPPGEWRAGQL